MTLYICRDRDVPCAERREDWCDACPLHRNVWYWSRPWGDAAFRITRADGTVVMIGFCALDEDLNRICEAKQ